MQAYSDIKRESEEFSLPDVEVFYISNYAIERTRNSHLEVSTMTEAGWYWWTCFPGCMPDSDAFGPYATEAEALADAQDIE